MGGGGGGGGLLLTHFSSVFTSHISAHQIRPNHWWDYAINTGNEKKVCHAAFHRPKHSHISTNKFRPYFIWEERALGLTEDTLSCVMMVNLKRNSSQNSQRDVTLCFSNAPESHPFLSVQCTYPDYTEAWDDPNPPCGERGSQQNTEKTHCFISHQLARLGIGTQNNTAFIWTHFVKRQLEIISCAQI